MFTTTNSRGRPFGPDGCQVPVGLGTCGETGTLDIINEFKRLYEEKMHEIDTAGGGDCLQEKVKLQQEWISDLSDQNEMLVRAVEELEHEATERVRILEEKLQKSAQCLCEEKEKLKITESSIKELEVQIGYFKSFGDVEGMAKELNCKRAECENLKTDIEEQREEIKTLLEEVVVLESEKELIKNDVKNSVGALQEKIRQSVYEVKGSVQDLGNIVENLDVNHKVIQSPPQAGFVDLKCAVEVKDKQLRDQLDLIKILVCKLFSIDRGLEYLEGKVSSACEINKENYLKKKRT